MRPSPAAMRRADQRGGILPALLAVVGVVALGVASFLVSRALVSGPAEEPLLVPIAQPGFSAELHPDLPLDEALAGIGALPFTPVDDALLEVAPEDVVDDQEPLLDIPAAGPLPPGLSRPDEPVDLRAYGHILEDVDTLVTMAVGQDGMPPQAPTSGSDGSRDTDAAPSSAPSDESSERPAIVDLHEAVLVPADGVVPAVTADAADDPTADDADDPTADDAPAVVSEDPPSLDAEEAGDPPAVASDDPPTVDADDLRDDELSFLLPPTLSISDDPALVRMVTGGEEPGFLDVCAAEVEGRPLDCGDGTSATVLPFARPLTLVGVAVDPGPRCLDHLDVPDGHFPLRMTFRGTPTSTIDVTIPLGPGWPALTGFAPIDRDRVRLHLEERRVHFDQCVALRWPDEPGEILQLTGRTTNARTGEYVTFEARFVAPAPPAGDRPPTAVNTVSDRRVRVTAWTRPGVEVAATLIARDTTLPALTSQCTAVESGAVPPQPGRVVELAPAGQLRLVAPEGYDPAYDAVERFAAALDLTSGDRFELCLRWEEVVGGARRVIDREAYYLDPPERPTVEIVVTEGSFVEPGHQPSDLPSAAIVSFRSDGPEEAAERCTWFRQPRVGLEPLPQTLCTFEALDGLQGGRLELLTSVRGDFRDAQRRSFRVLLPTDPAHHRFGEPCDRCVDLYDLPLSDPGGRSIGRIQVAVVATGRSAPTGWISFPLHVDVDERDFPVLDAERTRVITALDGQDRNLLGVEVVADRPVITTLVARPRGQYVPSQPAPPGCPEERTPHRARTFVHETAPRVVIPTACALTGYHLALELRDEDGNTAVYGDPMTWMLGIEIENSPNWLRDGNYVPGVWNPRVTTPGRLWEVDWQVRVNHVTLDSALPPGVYAGPPRGPSGRIEVPPFPYEADRSRITLVEAQAGPIHISRGRHNGPTPCVDQDGKVFRLSDTALRDAVLQPSARGLPIVEVGDHLTVSAQVRMESLLGNPHTMLDGFNRCKGDVRFIRSGSLPRGADGGPPWVLADDVEAATQLTIVVQAPTYFGGELTSQFQMITEILVRPVEGEGT